MRSSFLNSPEVLVVEASAGSGKTYALSKRYVQLALHLAQTQRVPIQSILAITFTNKATWAMKTRILEFLKRMALKQLKPFEVDDLLVPLGLDSAKASQLAFGIMGDVIRQYHYFQVQTIDSFINALLCGCSFKVGLSAHFKIQRNSREYLQLSLDELLDEAPTNRDVHRLFEKFIRQYLFLENRSSWFPKEDLLNVMATLFAQYNTFQKPLVIYPNEKDLFLKKKQLFGMMQELQDLCPPQTNKRFLDYLSHFLTTHQGSFDIDDLKSYWAREEFPINKGGVVSKPLAMLWKGLRDGIHDLCMLEAYTMFNAYTDLFEALRHHFIRLSRRDDIMFLEELNRKAAALFEENLVTVEELYFRLAARFGHFLIDEFQDTSLAQWRNISLMVHEALATGGSLFYVGDKKQAIYAFRGGESRLFDALQSQLSDFNVKIQALSHNYRSAREVIAFNNQVFSVDNLREFLNRKSADDVAHDRKEIDFTSQDFDDIARTYAHSFQIQGNELTGGVVRVERLDGKTKADRNAQAKDRLVALVLEIRARVSLKEIAILTRGNQELEEITQWLLASGIQVQSERSSDVKNNPLVQELIAFLNFFHSPTDNNAFAQCCLGDLMPKATGLTPEELREFLFQCARRKSKIKEDYFYTFFQDVYPQVWANVFEELFRQVGVYPLYEFTTEIMARLGCETHFPHYQGFLMHLLTMIKSQEDQSCDFASFLDFYQNCEDQQRFVPMNQGDAVKVLTVHKAKGLEFPVVIVPFLEMDVKVSSGGRDGTQAYVLNIQAEGMGLIRLKSAYLQFCPELKAIHAQEYKKAFLIELNNVYVALTRAINELYVFVPQRVGNSVNPASFLIPEDCGVKGTPQAHVPAGSLSQSMRIIKPFINGQWLGKLREEFLIKSPIATSLARQGDMIHTLLMQVGNASGVDLLVILNNAWQKISYKDQSGDWAAQLIRLKELIGGDAWRKFFYLPEGVLVLCEQEFVNAYGDTRRIDRLIVQPKDVWVVDYKLTTVGRNEHQRQVLEYMSLVKYFYPNHRVGGHVLYIDEGTVESYE